jgi:glycosyltransferase involved in cell wall biosynthesis
MHLIAQKLHQKNNVKWLADFRDPWSDLYYNKEFKQLLFAQNRNKKLETLVLKSADCILTVSSSLKEVFLESAKRVEVISNGFDDEIFAIPEIRLDGMFSISYIGLLPKQSNPLILFKVLKELCDESIEFRKNLQLNFVGDISEEVKTAIKTNDLELNTVFLGYVSHKRAILLQKCSQVLLLLIPNVENNKGIVTGKLFEYLAAKRPILAMGPVDGDLATILEETNAGEVFAFDDHEKLKLEIKRLYRGYKEKTLFMASGNIEKYHRKELTKKLVFVLKSLIS